MRRFRLDLAEAGRTGPDTDGPAIDRILAAVDRALVVAGRALPEIETLHQRPLPLLQAWRDGEEAGTGWLADVETALDGWARACLLWFDPGTGARRSAVIAELAVLTRTVGKGENRMQGDSPLESASALRLLQARNERLRARELQLDAGAA